MNRNNFNFLFALIVFIAIVGCGVCSKSEKQEKELQNPEVLVSAETLVKDYRENEVSADDKYKNKILEVTGIVSQVQKEGLSKIIVVLKKPKSYWGVRCQLKKEFKEEAKELQTGDVISIVGKCSGLKKESPYLRNCRIDESTF
jgi:hypothetical protein